MSDIQDECQTLHTLIGPYALGATDPHETMAVRCHLRICAEARNQLHDYVALIVTLHEAIPLTQPAPPADRIL